MTPSEYILSSLLLAAIYAAVRLFFANLHLKNDKRMLTQQIDDLSRKIQDRTEDEINSFKEISSQHQAEVKHKDKQIEYVHKELDVYSDRDRSWSRIVESRDADIRQLKADIDKLKGSAQ